MTPKEFYYIRDGQKLGPFSKRELQMAACKGEVTSDTLYTYDHARKWYPLSRLIGDVSKLDPQVIEDTWPRYFIACGNETVGPHCYWDIYFMIIARIVNHQTLYKTENSANWKPLSKLPVPHIPKFVPENPSRKTEWIQESKRECNIGGINFFAMIGRGPSRTEEGYFVLKVHGPKGYHKGDLFVSGQYTKGDLQKMLADGGIQFNTPCAKENGPEWLTVKDFL